MRPYPEKIHRLAPLVRCAIALATVLICVWGAIVSARAGLSRLFSEYGLATNSLEATERARDFNAADPTAHYAAAVELENLGKTAEAIAELERAASLRPRDYFLWQELGRLREDNGDMAESVSALRRAIELAPHYSQAHWQLGNLFLRRSEFNEAFTEMRIAVSNDPMLLPVMADLAWSVCDSDVECVLAATQPKNDSERFSLGRFFIAQKLIDAGLDLILAASKIEPDERRELVKVLIDAQEFQAAYKVWLKGLSGYVQRDDLFDGGFEGAMNFDDSGFEWRPANAQTIKVLLDPNNPQSGRCSLMLEYGGNFDPMVPVISQLILVAPGARYRLSFAARTERLFSAALPVVVIKDATGNRRVIEQSASLSRGTQDWREYSIDFETADTSTAITVDIQRQVCSANPCPIMGRASFDNFSLIRL